MIAERAMGIAEERPSGSWTTVMVVLMMFRFHFWCVRAIAGLTVQRIQGQTQAAIGRTSPTTHPHCQIRVYLYLLSPTANHRTAHRNRRGTTAVRRTSIASGRRQHVQSHPASSLRLASLERSWMPASS